KMGDEVAAGHIIDLEIAVLASFPKVFRFEALNHSDGWDGDRTLVETRIGENPRHFDHARIQSVAGHQPDNERAAHVIFPRLRKLRFFLHVLSHGFWHKVAWFATRSPSREAGQIKAHQSLHIAIVRVWAKRHVDTRCHDWVPGIEVYSTNNVAGMESQSLPVIVDGKRPTGKSAPGQLVPGVVFADLLAW